MLGLIGTLNMGARALQAQQAGVQIAGQNLSNVNNPAYARQRLQIATSLAIPSEVGPQGTGVQIVAIQQLRDLLLDAQIRTETSVGGYWNAQQGALLNAQTQLSEFLDQSASGISGAAGTGNTSISQGLSGRINALFTAFQDVSVDPASLTYRQALLDRGQTLAESFNQTSGRLEDLHNALNVSLSDDVESANLLLSDIAELNRQIAVSEMATGGTANDLRDSRQQKLEQLAELVNFDTMDGQLGAINISIDGNQLVSGQTVVDSLQVHDEWPNHWVVRTTSGAVSLALTGGSMQGTIDARDGALATLRSSLDDLAGALITEVNNLHAAGYDLNGNTGASFFSGTDAASITINNALLANPTAVQAAGVAGAQGDNSVALALANLGLQHITSLGDQTFSEAYALNISRFGNALATADSQVTNYAALSTMLLRQRDSTSGVSIEEEMTNLIIYQKAYQASAKIITTVDQMMDILVRLKS